jgi:hypothetical protein
MATPTALLIGLVDLLAGLAVGKAVVRYRLEQVMWDNRRTGRE